MLVSSCVFYTAFIPVYIFILFFTIGIDYWAGILIEGTNGIRKRWYLVVSIIANVGVLAIFKYYDFFAANLNELLAFWSIAVHPVPYLGILLPIGLSFHTFQAMSYTIEVYRGNQRAERHLGIYALYVMFYPQLVAGPIERPQNLLHQFHERKYFSYDNLTGGLKLMLWGLFKKIVIADRLSLFVNEVYGNPGNYQGLTFVAATIFFAIQIYCDFSGYSSIAQGSAQVMGFQLMNNFDRPYLALSVREFWQRWHISLSTWFRDYVYIPLGGSKTSAMKWYRNLFLTFLLSGFWHGASWNFVIWGALHGSFVLVEQSVMQRWRLLNRIPPGFRVVLGRLYVFLVVCLAWVFFRASSLPDALYILDSMLSVGSYDLTQLSLQLVPENRHSVYTIDIFLGWFWILFLAVVEFASARIILWGMYTPLRWAYYFSAILSLILLGVYESNQFIYFQF